MSEDLTMLLYIGIFAAGFVVGIISTVFDFARIGRENRRNINPPPPPGVRPSPPPNPPHIKRVI